MRYVLGIALALLLSAAVPAVAADEDDHDSLEGKFSYTPKKGLVFKTEDDEFKFHLSNRVQVRFTDEMPEVGDTVGSFRLRRWKFKMDGHAFGHWKYKLQVNFAASSVEGDNDAFLEDAYFQYTKNHWAQPFMGQGKAYFARQALTSSGKLQFVDRSIVTSGGGAEVARQIGAGVVGTDKNKKFEYNIGIYNGDGANSINKKKNENDKFLYVGRVVWTPFGEMKLVEPAVARPKTSKLAVGLKAAHDTRTEEFDPGGGDPVLDVDTEILAYGAELAYKIHGFSLVGEYFRVTNETVEPGMMGSPELIEVDEDLYYAQIGYVFPMELELAGRYAVVDPQGSLLDAQETEVGFAISYYFQGSNSYKVQADYRELDFAADPLRDTKVARVQFQFVF